MAHSNHCNHCRASLPAPRPRLYAGAALVAAYLITFAALFGFSLLGPLGIFFLPMMVPLGIGLISPAHEYASRRDVCPACGKEVVISEAPASARPIVAPARA